MAQQVTLNVNTKELGPWSPSIDARRFDKPGVIAGMNWIDDIDGPRSYFGSNFVNFNFWDPSTRQKINELRAGTDILYGTPTGVYRINTTSGVAEPILQVAVVNTFWPWTIAFVGGLYYLAQYDVGLWQYDPVNNSIAHVSTPVGEIVRYVIKSCGRLVIMSSTLYAWTALDDGTNFTPSLTNGAGAQGINIIGGTPMALCPLDDGFLCYTTVGIAKATFQQAAYIFKHEPLSTTIKIFSPNAVLYVPKLGALSLDDTGFNLIREFNYSDFGKPQPWEIEKGDYIRKNVLAGLDHTQIGVMGFYYSQIEQKLFLSFSGNTRIGVMTLNFVWTAVSKRWSSFDHQNTGIFETYNPINNIYTCSYVGTDGWMRAFQNSNVSQDVPALPATLYDYVYRVELEESVLAIVSAAGVVYQTCTTDINQSDNNPLFYGNYSTVIGVFYINYLPFSDTIDDGATDIPFSGNTCTTNINTQQQGVCELFAIPLTLPQIGLNSSIEMGPWRFQEQTQPDDTSALSGLLLGLSQVSDFNLFVDWNLTFGSEDWNTGSGTVDWGTGVTSPNAFDLTLTTSNDGYNAILTGDEELVVFNDLGSALKYAPFGYSGIWHTLTLEAVDAGQAYALKTIDFTGLLTGKLMTGT